MLALCARAADFPVWGDAPQAAFPHDAGTIVRTPLTGAWAVVTPAAYRLVPRDILHAAAADHCLLAAYRGECPGVDPDALLQWRAEQIAKGEDRAVEAVLADIERLRRIVRGMPRLSSQDRGDDPTLWTGTPDVVDLASSGPALARQLKKAVQLGLIPAEDVAAVGELGVTPELHEAAAREGFAYLAREREGGGREKVVLGAATPEQIRWFVEEFAPYPSAKLYGITADPRAGTVEGYLPNA